MGSLFSGAEVVTMVASVCAVAISYITLSTSRRLATAERAMRMTELLFAENVRAAVLMQGMQTQLSAIHDLVNSDKTRIITSLLGATRLYLIGLQEIVRLNRAAGENPTASMLAAIEETERSIVDLEAQLHHQATATKKIEDREKGTT